MLGRLAHWVRALGYDAVYLGPADDQYLLRLCREEDRILVTRDVKLAQAAAARGCLVRADRVREQLAEVVRRLTLEAPRDDWLSRCLECNTLLARRAGDAVGDRVPPRIRATHSEFWACPGCGKVYWAGSHAERILECLHRVLEGDSRP